MKSSDWVFGDKLSDFLLLYKLDIYNSDLR